MEAFVNKYFWVVRLLGVGCVLAFAASAAATQIGTSYIFTEPEGFTPRAAGAGAEAGEDEDEDDDDAGSSRDSKSPRKKGRSGKDKRKGKQSVVDEVLAYNVFCPQCQPVVETEEDEDKPIRPGEVKSKLPLMLLATMEADNELYSMATIQDSEQLTLGPYGIEDAIREGVVLKAVQRGRIVFLNGRQMEYIEMGDEAPPVAKPTIVTPKTRDNPAARKNSRAIEGAAEAIDCSGENCTVDREFVEKILSNPAMLAKQARVVPAVKDGETRGFKFYGIRSGSLPKLLGLKNGDLLTSVNGNELKSIDEALGLYTKLRRASNLSVVLERKGKTINKEIEIK